MGDGRVVPRLRFFSGLDHVTLLAPSLLLVVLALVLKATPVVRAESAETRGKALKGFTRAFFGGGVVWGGGSTFSHGCIPERTRNAVWWARTITLYFEFLTIKIQG